jgi:hypothetical protein
MAADMPRSEAITILVYQFEPLKGGIRHSQKQLRTDTQKAPQTGTTREIKARGTRPAAPIWTTGGPYRDLVDAVRLDHSEHCASSRVGRKPVS